MSLVKNRRRNMTEDESEDGALSRQAGTRKKFLKRAQEIILEKNISTQYIYSQGMKD